METEEKILAGFFGSILVIILGISFIGLVGLHIETGKGSHVGFVTSVETNGLFFKTNRIYLKTDTQSSQEDDYCVIDNSVFSDLKKFSESHSRVEVSYFDWFSKGISNCGHETGGIITSVKEIK